jgi:hypothetical protein
VVGVKKKTNMRGGMPPIEFGHGLECQKKIFIFPHIGNEDHMACSYGNERKEMVLKPYESTKFHHG